MSKVDSGGGEKDAEGQKTRHLNGNRRCPSRQPRAQVKWTQLLQATNF